MLSDLTMLHCIIIRSLKLPAPKKFGRPEHWNGDFYKYMYTLFIIIKRNRQP